MTLLATAFTTYDAKGLREQLSNIISNISPEDTPLYSMVAKQKGEAVLTEWQTDTLATAVTTNAQLEGDNVTSYTAVGATTRVGNYHQISRKLFAITGTDLAVKAAGRANEVALQTAKKGVELRRDIEYTIFDNIAGDAGGTTTARATATLGAWLKSNSSKASDGGTPTYTSGVPGAVRTDGTIRTLTETIFKAVISAMWTSGATTKWVFANSTNKALISAFSGIATQTNNLQAAKKPATIVAAADLYVSDFGVVQVIPQRFMRQRDLYFIDEEYLAVSNLRPMSRVKMPATADAEAYMMLQEWALVVKNEAAHGIAADLSA